MCKVNFFALPNQQFHKEIICFVLLHDDDENDDDDDNDDDVCLVLTLVDYCILIC